MKDVTYEADWRNRARAPSAEDLRAVRILMGQGVEKRATILRSWDITSSTGMAFYTVEERIAKDGKLYMWCPCPGWRFAFGKGKDCRHVEEARLLVGVER